MVRMVRISNLQSNLVYACKWLSRLVVPHTALETVSELALQISRTIRFVIDSLSKQKASRPPGWPAGLISA